MSDWSSDVCSYDLPVLLVGHAVQCTRAGQKVRELAELMGCPILQTSGGTAFIEGVEDRTFPYLFSDVGDEIVAKSDVVVAIGTEIGEPSHYGRGHLWANGNVDRKRSEEHTSELQSLMRISYAVFCLKKTK